MRGRYILGISTVNPHQVAVMCQLRSAGLHDEWQESRRYFSAESLAKLWPPATTRITRSLNYTLDGTLTTGKTPCTTKPTGTNSWGGNLKGGG